jgi:LacI family transcriptional regulator
MESLGYSPDFRGAALRTGKTASVGLIVPDLSNPVYSTIAAAAQEILYEEGYSLLLGAHGADVRREGDVLETFMTRGVDAIAFTPTSDTDARTNARLADSGVPVVLLDRQDPSKRFASVSCAHGQGMMLALEHVEQTGHKHVVVVDRPKETWPGRESARALREFADNSAMEIHATSVAKLQDDAARNVVLDNYRVLRQEKAAIIATSHPLLIGVLGALSELNIIPGSNISMIGTDDSQIAAVYNPPLTALHRDLRKVGEQLARAVINSIKTADDKTEEETAEEPVSILLPMTLMKRRSVRIWDW